MKKWWMEAVGYQIYPKSFFDSNNDGIGDIQGIIKKLPYLTNLGVNLLWICPFYKSPMDDNGYDVSDFFAVANEFGTLDDFKLLLKEAKKLDIKIILDFVLSHTSDEHPWFIESRASIRNSKRDYYIWRDGKVKDGIEVPPTNWGSFFGGSAWHKDNITNQYYMKIFSNKMPDLNWKNPQVINEMINVGKWWLDLGVDGFRIDAVSHLAKDKFVDSKLGEGTVLDWNKFSNLPDVHKYLKKMNKELFSQYDALTIGEVGGTASIQSGLDYSAYDSKQLSMVFNFDHNWCNNLHHIDSYDKLVTNVIDLKATFNNWQQAFYNKGWLPLNWLNHDQPRLMSHYGDMNYYLQSAKMLATALYFMRGTPFIYQGEEIGMTNYPFTEISEFRDISSRQYYDSLGDELTEDEKIFQVKKSSRDHPRTPMQWDSSKYGGFSNVEPWIKVNPNYTYINVNDNLLNSNSIFNYYKEVIDLRRASKYSDVIVYGTYHQRDLLNKNIYIYEREDEQYLLLIITSFNKKEVDFDLSDYKIIETIISNYEINIINNKNIITLRPYEALVLNVKRSK